MTTYAWPEASVAMALGPTCPVLSVGSFVVHVTCGAEGAATRERPSRVEQFPAIAFGPDTAAGQGSSVGATMPPAAARAREAEGVELAAAAAAEEERGGEAGGQESAGEPGSKQRSGAIREAEGRQAGRERAHGLLRVSVARADWCRQERSPRHPSAAGEEDA